MGGLQASVVRATADSSEQVGQQDDWRRALSTPAQEVAPSAAPDADDSGPFPSADSVGVTFLSSALRGHQPVDFPEYLGQFTVRLAAADTVHPLTFFESFPKDLFRLNTTQMTGGSGFILTLKEDDPEMFEEGGSSMTGEFLDAYSIRFELAAVTTSVSAHPIPPWIGILLVE